MTPEWTPNALLLYRDGALMATIDGDVHAIPDTNHALVIQLDAIGELIPGPVELQIDYVKVQALGSC